MSIASIKRDLLESLKDREFRGSFRWEHVYATICFQIRALREQREKSQKELGRLVKPTMAQERISILEDPNAETKPTIATLLRIADGLDIGLDIRFVPFGTVLDKSVRTNMKDLEVKSFSDELPELERDIRFDEYLDDMIALQKQSSAGRAVFIDTRKPVEDALAKKEQGGADNSGAATSNGQQGGNLNEAFSHNTGQSNRRYGHTRPESERHGILAGTGA